jgi:hypothetical protein
MGNSNFCANCGARLTRKSWRAWIRGALCDDCATRLGAPRTKTIVAAVITLIAAFAFGRYLRPAPPPLIIQRAANSPLSDLPVNPDDLAKANPANQTVKTSNVTAEDDAVYICGARTKKGTPCRRRVHMAGERCYQHKGMPAMVPLEKLTIKPETAKK